MERPLRRFECGPGAPEMRGVTVFGIQRDRIVPGRLCMEDAGRPGGTIDQAVRRMTTIACLFTTA